MISDYEILTFMKQSDDPAFTPNEIADHFDLTNSAARRRLYNLVEDGKLGFKSPVTGRCCSGSRAITRSTLPKHSAGVLRQSASIARSGCRSSFFK